MGGGVVGAGLNRILADVDIRDMVRDCRFVVLPIRQTTQPSGQSACLQAMACGKTVILSDIRGIWDRTAMKHGETCVLVPSGDPEGLRQAVERLLASADLARRIGDNARRMIQTRLHVGIMADAMMRVLATPTGAV